MKKTHTLGLMVLTAATAAAFALVSCGSDDKKDTSAGTGATATTTTVPTSVSFTSDLKPIITAKCATSGCHAKGGVEPDYSAVSESTWTKADQATITATKSTMPKAGPLPAADIAKFKAYTPKQ